MLYSCGLVVNILCVGCGSLVEFPTHYTPRRGQPVARCGLINRYARVVRITIHSLLASVSRCFLHSFHTTNNYNYVLKGV